jgi:predicted nucleic acid-binding protein
MKSYVIDACALIAYFHNEQGALNVAEIFRQIADEKAIIFMHKVNLLEVYYDTIKRKNESFAKVIFDKICQKPVKIISDISDPLLFEAGRLKASYKISIADSIALATAFIYESELVTCDHHELDKIASKENIKFFWIR